MTNQIPEDHDEKPVTCSSCGGFYCADCVDKCPHCGSIHVQSKD